MNLKKLNLGQKSAWPKQGEKENQKFEDVINSRKPERERTIEGQVLKELEADHRFDNAVEDQHPKATDGLPKVESATGLLAKVDITFADWLIKYKL